MLEIVSAIGRTILFRMERFKYSRHFELEIS